MQIIDTLFHFTSKANCFTYAKTKIPTADESIQFVSSQFTSISMDSMTGTKCTLLLADFNRFQDVVCAHMGDLVANKPIGKVNNLFRIYIWGMVKPTLAGSARDCLSAAKSQTQIKTTCVYLEKINQFYVVS